MSNENVVAFPGYSVPTPAGEPVQSVVEILREYLEKAEAGQVVGVGIAIVMRDGTKASEWIDSDFSAGASYAWSLNAAVGRLTRRLEKHLDKFMNE
jgi:hypothetical protein